MPLPRLAFPHELGLAVTTKGAEIMLTITATVPAGQGLAFSDLCDGQIVPYFKADPAQLAGPATATVSGPFSAFTVHFAGGSIEQIKLKAGDTAYLKDTWAYSASAKVMVRRAGPTRLVAMAVATAAGRLNLAKEANSNTITATYVADHSAPSVKRSDGKHLIAGSLTYASLANAAKLNYNNEPVNIFDDQAPDHVVVIDLALAASTLG
jgi:hypothetical protein